MGRAARKGLQEAESDGLEPGGTRTHWTDTHPDRDMWSPGRLAIARTQTREEYEALYGRGEAAAPAVWTLEDEEGTILLRRRGQYPSAEEARESGDSLPLVEVGPDGIRISSLALGSIDEDMHAFALNEDQVRGLLGLADPHFPDVISSPPLDTMWKEGLDLFGGSSNVVGPFQYPHVTNILDQEITKLGGGDRLSLDTESYLQVHKKEDRYLLVFNKEATEFDSIADVVDRALVQAQGNDFLFAPKRIRPLDPFAGTSQPIDQNDPLVEIASQGSAKMWANRDGAFVLDVNGKEVLLGWMQSGETVLAQSEPADLDSDAAALLIQFLRSSRKVDGKSV